jgi:hypothetical protein
VAPTPSGDEKCKDHSGCLSDIKTLKESDRDQWDAINSMKARIDVVLGGVAMSCILLVINLITGRG